MIKTAKHREPVRMKVNCYVYLIQEQIKGSKGAVKIGLSANIERRIENMQVGNSRRLKLIATMGPFHEIKATCFEQQLHRRFKKHRIRGEWFSYRCLARLQNYDEINPSLS